MSKTSQIRGMEWYGCNPNPILGPNHLPLLRIRIYSMQGSGTHLGRKRTPPSGPQVGGTHRKHRPTLFGVGS